MKYIFLLLVLLLTSCAGDISSVKSEEIFEQEIVVSSWAIIPEQIMNTDTENTPLSDDCLVFDNFSESSDYKWGIVNDGVMWGKSQWTSSIADEKLIFSWTIVTRWGGFSSLRAWLELWIITDYNSVKLRAKSDWREYRITLRDNQWGNISHRLIIPFVTPGEFEEISINFTDLEPAYFGRIVKADPFEKESARGIWVILSDWVDWEFSLEIDEVKFCN